MPKRIPTPIGQRFGRLVVIGDGGVRAGNSQWECRCDCGTVWIANAQNVKHGYTTTCSCSWRTHGQSYDPTVPYHCWTSMRERCRNPNAQAYPLYGGKGIYVVDEWLDFVMFRDWALANGWQPGLTIDRIDSDGPYAPWNCRFVTRQENSSRATGRLWTAWGETKAIYQWANDPRCVVSCNVLYARLGKGWEPERALTQPNRRGANAGVPYEH